MRILKRNLAFVLAMVMALSLTVSAANVTDYTDADDITFVEAVDVMTAIGVLEGTDGAFNPTKTLTREEGAKIIAYLMLGKTAADNLNVAEAPFVDVPANRWSAGYVAYCASQGIVKGVNANEFNPKGELTGTAFATMLLRAVGYGVNGEFEGFGWESEVNALALKLGVFKGNLGVNFSAACKREEAALYAFNTLKDIHTVNYSELFGTYYAGSTVLDTATENYQTLNEECGYYVYSHDDVDEATDAFGRHGHVWVDEQGTEKTSDDVVLTGIYGSTADLVYTVAIDDEKVLEALDMEEEDVESISVIRNGKTVNNIATLADVEALTGKGVLTEIYENDGAIEVIIIHTYLAQVESYDEEDKIVTVNYLSAGATADMETYETAVEYEEDDFVLVTAAWVDGAYAVQAMELAELVEGELTAKKSGTYVKLDGEKYNYAFKANADALNGAKFDVDNTLVVDNYGYALYITETTVDTTVEVEGFGVVTTYSNLNKAVDTDNFDTIEDVAVTLKIKDLVTGTTTKVALPFAYDEDDEIWEVLFNGEWAEASIENNVLTAIPVETEVVYGYNMTDDGIELYELAEIDANVVDLSGETLAFDGTRAIEEYRMNKSTVTNVYDTEAKKANEYEGYADLEDLTVEVTYGVAILADDEKTIVEAQLMGLAGFDVDEENTYAYLSAKYMSATEEVTVEVVIDGEYESYVVAGAKAESDVPATGTIYEYTIEDDEITLEAVETIEGTVKTVNDDYLKVEVAEESYVTEYFGDVEVYDLTIETEDGSAANVGVDGLTKNDEVVVLVVNADIILVFIVE